MGVPASIYKGDTVKFNIPATPDYASNQSWVSTFVLKHNTGNDSITDTGVADGAGGWDFTLTDEETATLHVAAHWYQLYVTKSGERYTLEQGQIRVIGNVAGAGNTYDGRSQAQIDLESVQAAIRTKITGGAVAEYTIGNRSLKSMSMPDLIALESKLRADVSREARAERIAKGLNSGRAVYVRFGG